MRSTSHFTKKMVLLLGILLLAINVLSIFLVTSGRAQSAKTQVLYVGDSYGKEFVSLGLDTEHITITSQSSSEAFFVNLNTYDVVVLNDVNLTLGDLNTLDAWAQQDEHGLLIFMGPQLTKGNQILSRFGFTDETTFLNNTGVAPDDEEFDKRKGLSVVSTEESLQNHPIINSIVWNTAPETFYMTLIPNVKSGVTTFVKMQWNDANMEAADLKVYPIIAGVQHGSNARVNVFVFAGWFQKGFQTTIANEHFMVWPYFNYLLYATMQSSIGKEVPVFGKWNLSPVPHETQQIILGISIGIVTIGAFIVYIRIRKRRNKQVAYFVTEKLATIQAKGEEQAIQKTEVIIDQVPLEVLKEKGLLVDKGNPWERIGFHRQLAGFLKLFFFMMILIIPQLLITSMIIPQFINPYPQSSGWYSYTLHAFEAIWLVFDLGFNYAITKFFAQHRIERPEKAFHYLQVFIWWEMLSGTAQLIIFGVIGSIVLPFTNFNYLSWMFVTHSLIQFPGIFLVFQYVFQGMQRSDYHMISYALQQLVLRLALQVGTIPLFKWLIGSNPIYGPAFGACIGLLVGQMLGDWALFFITERLYIKLGLKLGPIFQADFTKEEFLESLKFGAKMAIGELWVPLMWFLHVYLVVQYLPNGSQQQGYFELAFTIAQVPMAIALLTNDMLGGLTEAHTYKKQNLLNYDTISGLKWGNTWTYYLSAAFWAIGPTFILGASGPLWIKSAQLLPYFLVARILGPPTWMGDAEFPAAGKPHYSAYAWFIEQGTRAALSIIFILKFRTMESLLLAYVISIVTKDIFYLVITRIKIHRWPWNFWVTFIAPALSAGIIYLLFSAFNTLIVNLLGIGIISAMILLVVTLFVGEYFHSFIYAFLGGYDDNTLAELDESTRMVTGVKGLARFYYYCAFAGAKISPLHNKFKIKIYDAARKEADELTAIKRRIA